MTEQVRAYIYRIIVAASPLVVFYGLLSENAAALWIAFVANVLGVGMAAVNTSTKAKD